MLAAFLVAGSLLPLSSRLRLACAAAAGGILLMLLIARLKAHVPPAGKVGGDPVQSRIDRIRAERSARMGPRR